MILTIFFNVIAFFLLYFLLRFQLQKNIGVEKQIERIRTYFNDLVTDMNDAAARNSTNLEQKIKEAKKLIRQLNKDLQNFSFEEAKPPTEPVEVSPEEISPPPADKRESILKLHQKGLPYSEIADILDCQIGEVELVVLLDKKAKDA